MRLVLALLALLVVPALAVVMACAPYLNELQLSDPVEMFGIAQACVMTPQTDPEAIGLCNALKYYNWLGLAGLK